MTVRVYATASEKSAFVASCSSYDCVLSPGVQTLEYDTPDIASGSTKRNGASGRRQTPAFAAAKVLGGELSAPQLSKSVSTNQVISPSATSAMRRGSTVWPMTDG